MKIVKLAKISSFAMLCGLICHDTTSAKDGVKNPQRSAVHSAAQERRRPWWIVSKEDLVIPNETKIGSRNAQAWIFALLSRVEPYRFVPADEWHSPYCLNWNDGSTQCKRKKVEDEPQCSPISSPKAERGSDRSLIICSEFDRKKFDAICGSSIESNARGTFLCDIAPNGAKQCDHPSYTKLKDQGTSSTEVIVSPNNPFWPGYFLSGDGTLPISNRADGYDATSIICNKPQFTSN